MLTVIVPVYNAYEETGSCLMAVQRCVPAGTKVLLLDDASTDERILPLLQSWARRGGPRWQWIRHERNCGFVATANHGMDLATGDVVLLNSDTRVTPGWLDALARCLRSDTRIATATPWTNNGEIASLPRFCHANPVPPDIDAVARVIATTGQPTYPEIPTAVGFCMAVSRAGLNALGPFDEDRFGRGYGEENDFSERARMAGLRNVLCDDAYVAHLGGRSFGPLGLRPDEGSMARLLETHPGYLARVTGFIAADPLAARRQELLAALDKAGVVLG